MKEKKPCFVIAPIGEPDSETRKRSDQVLKHIIRPAVEACGYDAIRADQIDKPGIITSQVIQRVVGDPLVIADLTETNPNVFYELAIRHAIRKPLVQLIKKGDRIPFDVAGTRTIQVDHHDLDSVESAKQEIIKQINALENDQTEIETPISVSLDLQLLRQSENPEERSLADVLATVSEVRSSLAKIESRLGSKPGTDVVDEIRGAMRELVPSLERELVSGGVFLRRKRRIDPFIIRDLAHNAFEREKDPNAILVILSYFRDDLPWLYELGLELYRSIRNNDWKNAEALANSIRKLIDLTMRGPFAEELGFNRKDLYIIIDELPMLLERLMMQKPVLKRPR